eukprot:snap_masked-scaffold25_size650667-processed-gene-5.22 protein:Tk06721 transcript:snap_masked-scaffold25_size650667-processed-gene-5.22-mRNA-1 annotation:"hypothetical protein AaeL_AAEL007475"
MVRRTLIPLPQATVNRAVWTEPIRPLASTSPPVSPSGASGASPAPRPSWSESGHWLRSRCPGWSAGLPVALSWSDVLFCLSLCLAWTLIWLMCLEESPRLAEVSLGLTTVAGGLETMRSALYALPDVMAWPLAPSVRASGSERPLMVPPNSLFLDDEALVERLVGHPNFLNLLRRISARQVEDLQLQLEAVEREKVGQMEARLQTVLAAGVRQKERLQAEILAMRQTRQTQVNRRLQRLERVAQSQVDAAVARVEREMASLRVQMLASDSSTQTPLASDALAALTTQLHQLGRDEARLQSRLATCCLTPAQRQSEIELAVSHWLAQLTPENNPAVQRLQASLAQHCVTPEGLANWTQTQIRQMKESWTTTIQPDLSPESVRQLARDVMTEPEFQAQIHDTLIAQSHAVPSSELASLNETRIQAMMEQALRIYDADKTGLFDYALESIGGSILTTRCTETYDSVNAVYSVFGIPFWWERNTPRVMLQPGANPGQCWAFKGSHGSVVVQLSEEIHVHAVTLEHMAKMVAPTKLIDSAPQRFAIFGLRTSHDEDPVALGNFTYRDNGIAIQTFPVDPQHREQIFRIVELKVLSNHGNILYTCIYRLRKFGVSLIHIMLHVLEVTIFIALIPASVLGNLCWKPGSNPFYGQPRATRTGLDYVKLEWSDIFDGGSDCQLVDFMIKSHPRFKPAQYKLSDFTLKSQRSATVKVERGVDYVFQIIARENKGAQLGIEYKYSPMVTNYAMKLGSSDRVVNAQLASSPRQSPPITHEIRTTPPTSPAPMTTPKTFLVPITRALPSSRERTNDQGLTGPTLFSPLDKCIPALSASNGFGHGSNMKTDRIIVNFIRFLNRQSQVEVGQFLATRKGCDAQHKKGFEVTCPGRQAVCCSSPWTSCSSDRLGESQACVSDYFTCDGHCIPQKWVNDGWPDCLDGSDETEGVDRMARTLPQDLGCLQCSSVVLASMALCSNSGSGVTRQCVEDMMGEGDCNSCIGDFLRL